MAGSDKRSSPTPSSSTAKSPGNPHFPIPPLSIVTREYHSGGVNFGDSSPEIASPSDSDFFGEEKTRQAQDENRAQSKTLPPLKPIDLWENNNTGDETIGSPTDVMLKYDTLSQFQKGVNAERAARERNESTEKRLELVKRLGDEEEDAVSQRSPFTPKETKDSDDEDFVAVPEAQKVLATKVESKGKGKERVDEDREQKSKEFWRNFRSK